jgi:WD40 repeat protein
VSDAVAAILRSDVDWNALPADTPAIAKLVRRCLEGDPQKRLPHIGVGRLEIDERDPQFSPEGTWIAYRSDESGRPEIYVQPFPGPEGSRLFAWRVDPRSDRRRFCSRRISSAPSVCSAAVRRLTRRTTLSDQHGRRRLTLVLNWRAPN